MKQFIFVSLIMICISCISADKDGVVGERPNILLIVSDDHGMGDAGCYGNPVIQTPNLDYLASEGILFNNAFCTSASCSASRSVILTGLYNHANGQFGHQHSFHHFRTFDHIKSLPMLLAEEGYRTARIGKYHVGPDKVYPFDLVLDGQCRSPVEMADACKPVLSSEDDSPFFLYFCTCDPHRGGGKVESDPYQPDRFGNREEGWPGIVSVHYDPGEVIVPDYLPNLPATRAELAQYYESVSRVDQGLGHLFELLKEYGKWENTVIIYISDNGIAFPGAKTNLYEPGMKLPCIVYDPLSGTKDAVTDALICWADITPTILDYAGILPEDNSIPGTTPVEWKSLEIPRPSKFHGRSFKEVVKNPEAEGFKEIYASHTFHEITMYYPMRVVRTQEYKLIWNIASGLDYPHASDLWESATWQAALESESGKYAGRTIESYSHRPTFELYNIQEDPLEWNNLAYKAEYVNELEELKTKLKNFQERTMDPWIVKWEHE